MTRRTYQLLKAVDTGHVRPRGWRQEGPFETLERRGLVTIPVSGAVELTPEGRQAVKLRKQRHYGV